MAFMISHHDASPCVHHASGATMQSSGQRHTPSATHSASVSGSGGAQPPWTANDDVALAEAVGPGHGGGHRELEPGLNLVWGWDSGAFQLRVQSDHPAAPSNRHTPAPILDLGETFAGPVSPTATPSPRTI